MRKYFGTDGVRGVANQELTPELAYQIGRCGGYVLTEGTTRPKVAVGRDTRVSGGMLEAALIAGLTSIGVQVIRLGIVPTPCVAYLTRHFSWDAGVMISASHNPIEDNGIKFFGADGFKLSDETELQIEVLIDRKEGTIPRPTGCNVGTITEMLEAKSLYLDHLKTTIDTDFSGFKVVIDAAHGAAYELAPHMFKMLGAEVIGIGVTPDGYNINDQCGSTHPEALAREVVERGADIGLAFDGDADRLIAVDETGEVLDGDFILMLCAEYMKRKGRLNKHTVVTTVMSNMGFFKAANGLGISVVKAAVGDRYVMQEMREKGYNLGGEQSGHVIFLDHMTTGDGLLTAIQLMEMMVASGSKMSTLKQMMRKFPQVMVNVRVKDKTKYAANEVILSAVKEAEHTLGEEGRLLVRPSGTEALIRVMAEGSEEDLIIQVVDRLANVVQSELG